MWCIFDKFEGNRIKLVPFNNDLDYILNQIGVQCTDIPHLNKNPMWNRHPNLNTDKLYKLYYKDESVKNWVKEKYKNDFKLFNYELDI